MTQAGKPEEKLELAFRLYDIDRNGSIEEDEMTEIIKVGCPSSRMGGNLVILAIHSNVCDPEHTCIIQYQFRGNVISTSSLHLRDVVALVP